MRPPVGPNEVLEIEEVPHHEGVRYACLTCILIDAEPRLLGDKVRMRG